MRGNQEEAWGPEKTGKDLPRYIEKNATEELENSGSPQISDGQTLILVFLCGLQLFIFNILEPYDRIFNLKVKTNVPI